MYIYIYILEYYIYIYILEYYIYNIYIYVFIYTMSTLLTKELQAKEYTIYNICIYIPRNSTISIYLETLPSIILMAFMSPC